MKKTLSFLSVLVLTAGTLVSCGDKEDEGSSKKKSKKSENSIIGTWMPGEDTMNEIQEKLGGSGAEIEKAELVITDKDITLTAHVNASELLCVTDEGFNLYGQSFDKEYDGEVITLIAEGQKVAEFIRLDDPDEDNVYGKYSNDELSKSISGGEMILDFAESGVSYMIMSEKQEYTYDEKAGKITTTNADGEEEESEIKLDGDTLTVTDEAGKAQTYNRAD